MMKVIQVMPEFGLAGAEIMCENLMYGLALNGVDVVAVSLYEYHSAITDRLEKHGFKIIYLGKKRGFDFSVYRKLDKLVKREKPDVIHTHRYVMEYVIPVGVRNHIPTMVHTVHSVASKEQEKSKRIIANLFYHCCGVIPVALSDEIKNTIVDEYNLKRKDIPVIFNGEDLSRFIVKDDYSIVGRPQIYHIGRFLPVKNHKLIIDAAKELKNEGVLVDFHLLGDGSSSYGKDLISQVKAEQLGDIIHFDGLVPNVQDFLSHADIFVLPSLYEGVPMTLIEAMACGLPIVATRVGGVVDMLENNKSALLIDNSIDEFVEALKCLIFKQDVRERIGKEAYIRSRLFTNTKMADKYQEIYEREII